MRIDRKKAWLHTGLVFTGCVFASLWPRPAQAAHTPISILALAGDQGTQVKAATRLDAGARPESHVSPLASRSLPFLNPVLARRNSSPALVGGTEIFGYGVPKDGSSVELAIDLSDLSAAQKACQYWLVSGEQFFGDDAFLGGPSANRGLTDYTIEGTRDGKTWQPVPPARVSDGLQLIGNTVTHNTRRTTCHALDTRGFDKVRVKITAGRGWQGGQCGLNLSIYDASSCKTSADWQAIDGVTILGDSTCSLALQFVTDYSRQIATPAHPAPPVYAFGQPYSQALDFARQAAFYNEILHEKLGRFIVVVTGANDIPGAGWLASLDTLIKRDQAAGKVTMVCLPLYPNGPSTPNDSAPSRVRQGLDALYGGKSLVQHMRDTYASQPDVIISDALCQWSRANPGVMRPSDLHEAELPGWRAILAAEIKRRFFGDAAAPIVAHPNAGSEKPSLRR